MKKLFILYAFLLFSATSVQAQSTEVILFDDFEGLAPEVGSGRSFFEQRPTGFQDGTQVPGLTTSQFYSGSHAYGYGNAKYSNTTSSNHRMSIIYNLPPATDFQNRKVSFWMLSTTDSYGEVRVELDNIRLAAWNHHLNMSVPYTNALLSRGWEYREVTLPPTGTKLTIQFWARNAYPQAYDSTLGNAYIERLLVVGDRVSGNTLTYSSVPVLLSVDQARSVITAQCGSSDSCASDYGSCAFNVLKALQASKSLAAETYRNLSDEISSQVSWCAGYSQCSSAIPALEEQARQAGYTEGYAAGYKDGFSSGVASVNVEGIKSEAFAAGAASVPPPVCEITTQAQAISTFADLECPCDLKNKGQYVSCVTKKLQNLVTAGVITEDMRKVLQNQAAHSSCGK